jgi:hypothetical protein
VDLSIVMLVYHRVTPANFSNVGVIPI